MIEHAILEFFGDNRYLALGTLGSLALLLLALMCALALSIDWAARPEKENHMDGKPTVELYREDFSHAQDSLRTALGLLDQIKSSVPPFFVERFRACVSGAMNDLGMVVKS